jgi:hypothetical protein
VVRDPADFRRSLKRLAPFNRVCSTARSHSLCKLSSPTLVAADAGRIRSLNPHVSPHSQFSVVAKLPSY